MTEEVKAGLGIADENLGNPRLHCTPVTARNPPFFFSAPPRSPEEGSRTAPVSGRALAGSPSERDHWRATNKKPNDVPNFPEIPGSRSLVAHARNPSPRIIANGYFFWWRSAPAPDSACPGTEIRLQKVVNTTADCQHLSSSPFNPLYTPLSFCNFTPCAISEPTACLAVFCSAAREPTRNVQVIARALTSLSSPRTLLCRTDFPPLFPPASSGSLGSYRNALRLRGRPLTYDRGRAEYSAATWSCEEKAEKGSRRLPNRRRDPDASVEYLYPLVGLCLAIWCRWRSRRMCSKFESPPRLIPRT